MNTELSILTKISNSSEFWIPTIKEGIQQHVYAPFLYRTTDERYPPFYIHGVRFLYPDGSIRTEPDSAMYIDIPAFNPAQHIIKVGNDGRCVDEHEFRKYWQLEDDLVNPNTFGREPASFKQPLDFKEVFYD